MTESVLNFLKTNKSLLDTNLVEFFHSAYNELKWHQVDQLVEMLDSAGIDNLWAREHVLRFVIAMETAVLENPIRVLTFANRRIKGALGFSTEHIVDYIMENSNEWDCDIVFYNNDYWFDPRSELVESKLVIYD